LYVGPISSRVSFNVALSIVAGIIFAVGAGEASGYFAGSDFGSGYWIIIVVGAVAGGAGAEVVVVEEDPDEKSPPKMEIKITSTSNASKA